MFFECHFSISCSWISLPSQLLVKYNQIMTKLIILTVYRNLNRDVVYLQNVHKLIEDLYIAYKEANIWISGDFNLPTLLFIMHTL